MAKFQMTPEQQKRYQELSAQDARMGRNLTQGQARAFFKTSKKDWETKQAEKAELASAAQQSGLSVPGSMIGQDSADLERIRSSIKLSAPDLSEAMRAQSGALMQGQQEQARRQMLAAQARSGVRGGSAAAMAARLAMQQGQQRAQQEQDVFLRNQFMKQAAELAREQMAFQELGSRRAAFASIAAAQAAQRKK
jgi:hypothetical protein